MYIFLIHLVILWRQCPCLFTVLSFKKEVRMIGRLVLLYKGTNPPAPPPHYAPKKELNTFSLESLRFSSEIQFWFQSISQKRITRRWLVILDNLILSFRFFSILATLLSTYSIVAFHTFNFLCFIFFPLHLFSLFSWRFICVSRY